MKGAIAVDTKNPADARALVATGAPVYLLVNPLEWHGPHLSLENDSLVAQGLARDLHARLAEREKDWPFLVAPSISAGCDVTHGPGAVETPYREVKRLVLGACRSLVAVGAKKVVIVTFHGGPNHGNALQAGVRFLAEHGVPALAPLHLVLAELLELDPARYRETFAHVQDSAERAAVERELRYDFHAGFFETSMSLHYAPESVAADFTKLPPCAPVEPVRAFTLAARVAGSLGAASLSRELTFLGHALGWCSLRPFPGYTGRPAHATPRAGAIFAKHIVDKYFDAARATFAGARPPKAVFGWLPAVSLGGRLGPPTPPPIRQG